MAGNARSGRRPKEPPAVRQGRPERPKKLTLDEAFFWHGVIEAAEHLELMDSSLCHAATRAWGLYCKVCLLATEDPIDKDIKSAVSTYGSLLDKLCARLAVDPLGRARSKPKKAAELDPLQAFLATAKYEDKPAKPRPRKKVVRKKTAKK